jgi:hypothetical protein
VRAPAVLPQRSRSAPPGAQEAGSAVASASPPATPRTPAGALSKSEPATPTLPQPARPAEALASHGSRTGGALGCFRPAAAQARAARCPEQP